MVRAVDGLLAFSKAFVMAMLMVKMLGESTRRTADFLAGGNGAGPT